MTGQRKKRCADCLWFDRSHQTLKDAPKELGYCRKKYPVVFAREGRYYGGWPLVEQDDFCGEFREDAA
jgi:hypothetical protein